jgi:hypothetical protein
MTIKYFQIICIRYASPRIFFIFLSQNNFSSGEGKVQSCFPYLSRLETLQNLFWLESNFKLFTNLQCQNLNIEEKKIEMFYELIKK